MLLAKAVSASIRHISRVGTRDRFPCFRESFGKERTQNNFTLNPHPHARGKKGEGHKTREVILRVILTKPCTNVAPFTAADVNLAKTTNACTDESATIFVCDGFEEYRRSIWG